MRRRQRALCAIGLSLSLGLTGCAIQVPADPKGTYDHVRGSTLRVGASPEHGLVESGSTGPAGELVDLIEGFATQHDADVEWTWGSEESLVGELEQQGIDVAIGGFTDKTPWSNRAAVTRGYPEIVGADGRSLVMLVPLGENRMLSELETYLDGAVR